MATAYDSKSTVSVDTELPAAASLAGTWPKTTASTILGAAIMANDGTNEVLIGGTATRGLDVNDTNAVTDDSAFGVATAKVFPGGYLADETATDSVDEGDVGVARMSLDRVQLVRQSTGTATHTGTTATVGDAATSTTLLAANTARSGAAIRNDSTARLYIEQGATATTSSVDYLDQGDIYELPMLAGSEVYRGIITGIWASDAGGSAYIRENV